MTVTLSTFSVIAGIGYGLLITGLFLWIVIKYLQERADRESYSKSSRVVVQGLIDKLKEISIGSIPVAASAKAPVGGITCDTLEKLSSNLERLAVKVGERREQLSQQMQRFVSLQSEYCLFKSLVKKADAEMFEVLINQVYEIRAKADADVPPQMDTNQGAQMPTNKDGQRPDLVPGSGENVNTAASACCSTVGAEG